MDIYEVAQNTKDVFLNSPKFPYRTGQLKNNFFDREEVLPNEIVITALEKPLVYYGHILEVAPSIRYALKKASKSKYSYVKHNNRHYRYIERCIDSDVIPFLENNYGVKRI